ncbi:DUF4387 family protein [Oceanibium sediminis]|uniref:DUF4387 family protein n=1 Tax=Oceanibium sediminis TaxID=2026339 RepID=UPI000DD43786|nr:DUF4387 family protein [Oceanibium sediminis]
MPELGSLVSRVRSKNAGPFWLTIDIFCGDTETFERLEPQLTTAAIAKLYDQPGQTLKRFAIPELHVLKFSMPRINIQGSRQDRDMHASQWAWLLSEMQVD